MLFGIKINNECNELEKGMSIFVQRCSLNSGGCFGTYILSLALQVGEDEQWHTVSNSI